jgi:NhaD family Na+/H+ antiporter
MTRIPATIAAALAALLLPLPALAAAEAPDLTASLYGYIAVAIFVLAYALVVTEEFLHVRKSKPVMVAAGVIWILIGIAYQQHGMGNAAGEAVRHMILEFAELLLFLIAAMTYINTMDERQVFNALRAQLVSRGFSLQSIFWITGLLAFFISPVADNLTTALLMAAVVIAIGGDKMRFVVVGCINIVVAANAGGAFSPFGDITTLMVWQKGIMEFQEFLALFVPSAVNWLVPAIFLAMAVPGGKPDPLKEEVTIRHGGWVVVGLFLFTIAMTVSLHSFLHLPPVLGMMTGLGLLKVYGFFIRRADLREGEEPVSEPEEIGLSVDDRETFHHHFKPRHRPFDIYTSLKRAEWDTLMFFYGVVLAVGGLGTLGYLALISEAMYGGLGATWANTLVGVLSAIVDNIPVMFAVLTMEPDMSHGQWLLVTLTAGVGGSLLSIGSAAGVALMGQARGVYTFFAHLKWSWAIALGYAASIQTHLWLNADLF